MVRNVHTRRTILMKFADLRLIEPILRAIASENYVIATPIQAQAIPHALEGRDILGSAQTGTGKTAAFALPILQRLSESKKPQSGPTRARALILCPTRELAAQISESFQVYGKNLQLRHVVIYGGVNQNPQVNALRRGIDIVVATPGRLLDLMNQGHVDLRSVEVLVLDEADRMMDMGFIHDIRKVVAKLPPTRQTLFFSATMPKEIRQLANTILRNPVTVEVATVSSTADGVEQSVYMVNKGHKPALLAHLVDTLPMARAIVFTRTKRGADRVVRHLHGSGIKAEAIHSNKSQNARQRALANFAANKIPVLVATDIASRGIDVDGITHVVNYDISNEPETYVHRIGRTARAGANGSAVSFCDPEEVSWLRAIERLIRKSIPVKKDHPTYSAVAVDTHEPSDRRPQGQRHSTSGHNAPRPYAPRQQGYQSQGQSHAPRRNAEVVQKPGHASRTDAGRGVKAVMGVQTATAQLTAAPGRGPRGASKRRGGARRRIF